MRLTTLVIITLIGGALSLMAPSDDERVSASNLASSGSELAATKSEIARR